MSVIAIAGIPPKWGLKFVVKSVARIIAGKFEALNFVSGINDKTCYLRLSQMLDPAQVVERLNETGIPKLKIRAFIPDVVPNLPVSKKPKTIPQKLARTLKIQQEDTPHRILIATHTELMVELQSKFTGLFNLSRRTPNHLLLATIAETLIDRLRVIMVSNAVAASGCFKLSRAYRRLHPHFGDFQMILSTLHALQDARGVARTHVTEEELMAVNTSPFSIENIPYDKVQAATTKFSMKITKKVLDHIRNLNLEEGDSAEDVARKRVRKELQNLAQHLPSIIRQVIQKHLSPEPTPYHRMRIYGEPGIPGKDQMGLLSRRFSAKKVVHSQRMYNLLMMNVPPEKYSKAMSHDGVVMGGAKLVIRSSDIPVMYKMPQNKFREVAAMFGAEYNDDEYALLDYDIDMDAEAAS